MLEEHHRSHQKQKSVSLLMRKYVKNKMEQWKINCIGFHDKPLKK